MSDTRSQLEEVDALIATTPDDPALRQLREDLVQLIALEEQELSGHAPAPSAVEASVAGVENHGLKNRPSGGGDAAHESSEQKPSANYTAQGTFMEHHIASKEAVAEAPDLGAFQPVVSSTKSAAISQPAMKSGDAAHAEKSNVHLKNISVNIDAAATTTTQPTEKKKKKKKKMSDDAVLGAKFELPSHLVPLESDTPAQKLKKQRTAKALKSKFREKQKEAEHSRRQNDWKSFASKAGGKRRQGGVGSSSIFSTEEGVNARVGVISGGGGRKMTDFADPNKRHKFS